MYSKKLLLIGFFILAAPNGPVRGDAVKNIHSFSAQRIDGTETQLSSFKGKALLIVNTASQCGFTPQYRSLEALYETYKERGFEVLAFPANNFGNQEPGANEEIKKFCELNYKTTFPLFAKISVKGREIHPLYRYLTTESGFNGDITWNFNKFLVDPEGRVAARFDSKTDPLSPDLIQELETLLSNRAVS